MTTLIHQEQNTQETTLLHEEVLPTDAYIAVEQSLGLQGEVALVGAKNAVLCSIASLILTDGTSVLTNVPNNADVLTMIELLEDLGARVWFYPEQNMLRVDTTTITRYNVKPEIMKKMRASVLVMGPLLARFGCTEIALPGGCLIGARPIDFHLKNFEKMGVALDIEGEFLKARAHALQAKTLVLEYPSVGATENLMMAATLTKGTTHILNAALEPEVLDLVAILTAMGAHINIVPPATLEIEGVDRLMPVEHAIMYDRLEAGSLLLAAAITGGDIHLPHADPGVLDVFLLKLEEMGHHLSYQRGKNGIRLKATPEPRAVSFRTSPYPGFPTDLQAPMMVAQCLAQGTSVIHETVFENRFLHIRELQKMGAQITLEGDRAKVTGVEELYGAHVIASDIRASCALVLAGLAARGKTVMTGINHWKRGYDALDLKLAQLGARITTKAA